MDESQGNRTMVWVVEAGQRDFEFIYGVFDTLERAIAGAQAYRSLYYDGAVENVRIYEVPLNRVLERDEFEFKHWPTVWSGRTE